MALSAESRFAAFLLHWHGVPWRRAGLDGLRRSLRQLQGISIAFSEFEPGLLGVRLRDHASLELDRLFRDGELVWQGDQRLGQQDARISLYAAGHFAQLGRIGVFAPGRREQCIRELLLQQPGVRFEHIVAQLNGFGDDVRRALWRLVWAGEASSDSLDALRARRSSSSSRLRGRRRSGYARRQRVLPGTAGRWRLLANPASGFAAAAERDHARVAQYLDRCGIVARFLTPGFDALEPRLAALESRGLAVRTRLLASGPGDEFSAPGAEYSWQVCEGDDEGAMLAAADPANPFGALLPWPPMKSRQRPGRMPGARVLIQAGRLLAWLSRDGRSLHTPRAQIDPAPVLALLRRSRQAQPLYLETIDGQGPYTTTWHEALLNAGFSVSRHAYLLRAGD